jgi:hypothetical protein
MTDTENNCIKELSCDVKELTHKVENLRLEVRQNMERQKGVAREVAGIRCEVFGIDGDPNRPGLKGQLRDVNATLESHGERLDGIKSRETWSLSLLQSVLLLAVGALITAAFRRWMP